MGTVFLLIWIVPGIIGICTGLWHGRRPAGTPKAFGGDVIHMLMVAAPLVFMVHMAWVAALMMADGGIAALAGWTLYWTALTALLWVPLMVICYIVRGLKEQRT
ncbi:hypothetical protein C8N43_3200 [Litoreibacter ponti]|uniref:Uncharacterized protein n=1 Tax=Litoreibacter ponti TaxID=1510457 RepID=A0A2T6BEA4_9RHOB|nr:hypothetical protein [Litoreibacter ponti]PTX54386.1 hypothetical protein C8N43_3200 [Litoreibacter ponti]